MQNRPKSKLMIIIAITLCVDLIYLLIRHDYEIYSYQFIRCNRKLVLMLLVDGALAASVFIFQAITKNRLLTPSIMGVDAVYMFVKVLLVFVFGVQSAFVTNIYLSFATSLLVMAIFSLLL